MLFQTSVLSLGASGESSEAKVGGEPGGAHSGSAGEGVDFEAGVVGDDEIAGCELGVVDGLERCVLCKGEAGFFRGGDGPEVGERLNVEGVGPGGGAEIAQLARA